MTVKTRGIGRLKPSGLRSVAGERFGVLCGVVAMSELKLHVNYA